MLYRILENQFQDNTIEFVPQYKVKVEPSFYGGEEDFKNFIERNANGMHSTVKYSTYDDALAYITVQKHLHETPVTINIHTIEWQNVIIF